MSEEYPVVDCHKSKDLEFARNLAKQMKEGYGRHNSNRSFRDNPRLTYGQWLERIRARGGSFRDIPTPYDTQDALVLAWHVAQENQQSRVIGRFGDNAIRADWKQCAIGDGAKELPYNPPESELIVVLNRQRSMGCTIWMPDGTTEPNNIERYIFERVRMRMTPDDGRTWQEETLWKRIS